MVWLRGCEGLTTIAGGASDRGVVAIVTEVYRPTVCPLMRTAAS